uniref:Photosystem I reaction center subunit IX n=1 Tax=Lotharella vacuolata TaxID=74820 RepID=A0A140JZV3_9EUKA|nr:photosystem I protein J [Lotharella vacuolata]BAU62630.1 photosystem I protein J [Lotharella vacuolata]
MNGFQRWLLSIPVFLTIWLSFTAALIIEINRFFPDSLVFSLNF